MNRAAHGWPLPPPSESDPPRVASHDRSLLLVVRPGPVGGQPGQGALEPPPLPGPRPARGGVGAAAVLADAGVAGDPAGRPGAARAGALRRGVLARGRAGRRDALAARDPRRPLEGASPRE